MVAPGHTTVPDPLIVPGVGGPALGLTLNVDAALVPQALTLLTLIVPDDIVAVNVIELVLLVPIQPGQLHAYEVAPTTGVTL